MESKKEKYLTSLYLVTICLQATINFVQLLNSPSEKKNAFLLGYSYSLLIIAAVFLFIIILSVILVVRNHLHNPTILDRLTEYLDRPGFLFFSYIFLLLLVLSDSVLFIITRNLMLNDRTAYYSNLSFENLINQITPLLYPYQDYLFKLLPAIKWFLVFGIDSILFIFVRLALKTRNKSVEKTKAYQKVLITVLFLFLILSLTVAINYPEKNPLIFNLHDLYEWIPAFALVSSIGMFLSLVYYSKNMVRYIMIGLVSLGIIFNLTNHMYTSSRMELFPKTSNALESFLVYPDKTYHFRLYPVINKFSKNYVGKEILISQELIDELSLSTENLIEFGRVSRVVIIEDTGILTKEKQRQLLKTQYSEILTYAWDTGSPNDHRWIFIETGLQDAESILVQRGNNEKIFIIPENIDEGSIGEAE